MAKQSSQQFSAKWFIHLSVSIFLVLALAGSTTGVRASSSNPAPSMAPICGGVVYHSGNIGSNTTWSAGSVHVLTDDVTVNAGSTLTIAGGAVIKADYSDDLIINGKLMAVGSLANPVYFTSIKDDDLCGDTNGDGVDSVGNENDWNGISFGPGSDASSSIQRAVIRYGGGWEAPILLHNVSPTLANITFTNNYTNGALLVGGNWTTKTLSSTTVVYWLDSDVTILAGNTLTISPGVKIKAGYSDSLYVNGKLVANGVLNTAPIIFTSERDDTVCGVGAANESICDTNNNGVDNVGNENDWDSIVFGPGSDASSSIQRAVIRYGGGWEAPILLNNVSPTLANITFTNNYTNGASIVGGNWTTKTLGSTTVVYWLNDDITILAGNTLTLLPGVKIKAGYSDSLYVNGKLVANGGKITTPVVFTSEKDDNVCGVGAANEAVCDTNNDLVYSSPARSDWGGISFGPGSDASSILKYADVKFSDVGVTLNIVSPTISFVTFKDNSYGMDLFTGTHPVLTCNNFENNYYYGIYNNQPLTVVTAKGQWWGSASGPYHSTNPGGTGDKVSNGVTFNPWATQECGPMNPPTNLRASDGTFTAKVQLGWNASSGATSYKVFRATSTGSTKSLLGTRWGVNNTAFTDKTATPGVTYYYWVKACKATLCTGYSIKDTGWRKLLPPTNLSASDGTYTTKVQLTWTVSKGATSYKVYRATSLGGARILRGSPTGASFADTTATKGVTYYYWVKAYRGTRFSAFSAFNTGWRK